MTISSGRRSLGIFMAVAIGICLVSALGTRAIRTDWGRIEIKTIRTITKEGYTLSADIYRPRAATAEKPAPLVVVAHGGTNGALLCHLLGFDAVPWEWERLVSFHASVSEVRPIDVSRRHAYSLFRFSDVAHLPPGLQTR